MPNVFFTADQHFDHVNILKYERPRFVNVDAMNAHMVKCWNDIVSKNDIVYHLGDLALAKASRWPEVVSSLNGKIHYIRGNHDNGVSPTSAVGKLFVWVRDTALIKVGEQKIFLCHYAMRTWDSSHHSAWHVYGHSHGNLAEDQNSKSTDVGVDCHDFYPVSFERLSEIMVTKTFVPVDHHKLSTEQ